MHHPDGEPPAGGALYPGPVIVITAVEAARLAPHLAVALRRGWLNRRLPPPLALTEAYERVRAAADLYRPAPDLPAPAPTSSRGHAAADTPPPLALSGQDRWLDSAQSAAVLGVSERHLRRLCLRGELEGSRGKGERWRIRASAVESLRAQRRQHADTH